jgi:hypothetical protein
MNFRNLFTITLLLFVFDLAGKAQQTGLTTKHGGDEPASVKLSGKVSVPMELSVKKAIVDVKINGKGPFKFIVDTGAGGTVMDQSLAAELALEQDGKATAGDFADPRGITANRNRIRTLEIGGATFTDFIALSWERSPLYQAGGPRGVLGMPLFKKLLLTIDYPGSKISIESGKLKKGSDVVEYQHNEFNLFGIPIKIGSGDYVATLDTGSPGGLSFPNSYMGKLPLVDQPKAVGRATTIGGETILYGAKLEETVSFGGHSFETPNVVFFNRLRNLNIGYGLLNQFAITIDQQNMLIRFAKSKEPKNSEW